MGFDGVGHFRSMDKVLSTQAGGQGLSEGKAWYELRDVNHKRTLRIATHRSARVTPFCSVPS
jgi:hypothetical protein